MSQNGNRCDDLLDLAHFVFPNTTVSTVIFHLVYLVSQWSTDQMCLSNNTRAVFLPASCHSWCPLSSVTALKTIQFVQIMTHIYV